MNIRGIDAEIRKLQQLEAKVKEAQRVGEKKVAEKIASQAIAAAPGSLGSHISVSQTTENTTINGGDDFSAYVEFGTGEFAAAYLANVPAEQVEEARKFFKNGKGRTPAHPFFFPAIYRNLPELIPTIEAELNKLNK